MKSSFFDLIDPNELEHQPIERAEILPSAWYTPAEYLSLENEAVFNKGRFSVKRELGVWHFQKLVKEHFYAYLKEIF